MASVNVGEADFDAVAAGCPTTGPCTYDGNTGGDTYGPTCRRC